jgi:hypothetical protein
MEKTVLVIAANSLSREPCGQPLVFDLGLGKGKPTTNSKVGVDLLRAGRGQVRESDL